MEVAGNKLLHGLLSSYTPTDICRACTAVFQFPAAMISSISEAGAVADWLAANSDSEKKG